MGDEHTIQYTDYVLQNCTPEPYITLLINVTPLVSKEKEVIIVNNLSSVCYLQVSKYIHFYLN